MKLFFRRIHLYLGLASGLLVVLVCLTGTILVFEDELTHLAHPGWYTVAPAATPRLSLAQLTEAVRAAKPKAKLNGFKIYADPTRSVEISLAGSGRPGQGGPGGREGRGRGEGGPGGEGRMRGEGGPGGEGRSGDGGRMRGEGRSDEAGRPQEGAPDAGSRPRGEQPSGSRDEGREPGRAQGGPGGGPGGRGPGGGGGGGSRLFLNPYTGAVLGEYKSQQSFFHLVEEIHRGLVAGRVGKTVMGINAVVFLFILGTGLVLWWPTVRRMLPQRLSIKWGSGWKRLNHDWHIVLGFYASVFLFIIALTGVGMAFDFVGKGINQLTHSPQQRPEPPTSAQPAPGAEKFTADAALALARQQAPDAESYSLQLPRDPEGSIQVGLLRPGALTERSTDDLYLDQYSGQVLRQQSYAAKPAGQRIRGLFKPIHTGAIFGLPSKILFFIIAVLGATFPITGAILWLNRTRKERKRGQPARVAMA